MSLTSAAPENTRSITHDDPSTKIWSSYISASRTHDRNLARNWKSDMDGMLIFAGLFSASVTAFIIESYKTLSPNNDEIMISLLAQISQQLTTISNASTPTNAIFAQSNLTIPEPFTPSTSSLVCNTLWFLSLGFSLACALSATLVEQWVRNYLQAIENRPTPHERARISAFLFKGLEKFKMAALVETIPLLLHISLLLFFAGLIEFLRPVNAAISNIVLGMLVSCAILYILATLIPIFRRNCPYRTPLSGVWWNIMKGLHLLRRPNLKFGGTMAIVGTMAEAREADAIEISPERDRRDLDAMIWTLKSLREDHEFEPFVEVIPKVVAGFDYSAKILLRKLLYHDDLSVKLSHRIPRLLVTCTGGILDTVLSQKRASTCLAAIWSLSMLSMHTDSSESGSGFFFLSHKTVRFDEYTLRDIKTVKRDVSAVADYAISAAAVIGRSLLDMYLDQVAEKEQQLMALMDRGEPRGAMNDYNRSNLDEWNPDRSSVHRLKRLYLAIQILEQHLVTAGGELSSPHPFVIISTIHLEMERLMFTLAHPAKETLNVAGDVFEALHKIRAVLHQVAYCLTLEYVGSILSNHTLPYEAFITIRRLLLAIDFQFSFTLDSQQQFVAYLDDALDLDKAGGPHIPQSIINVILGLTRGVNDPTCLMKAKNIITRSMKFFSNTDEAEKILSMLNDAVPLPLTSTLDLFSSHMYSNIKLDRPPKLSEMHASAAVTAVTGVPILQPQRQYENA
ncbi:hypothetical protein BDZ94DRAFT_1328504 [Collybia nuda]|uniref:DUF6535 domain-containing protein n=1 Tax=Collybia nuda TaxID=64659 RepID=A0A9P5YI44_9AGAR|nr:hypothetical protein BDZ94DRAFT_1328504 [Collybia nuda]